MHSQFEAAHMKSSSALASAAAMAQHAQANLQNIQQQHQQYSDSLASSSSTATSQVCRCPQTHRRMYFPADAADAVHALHVVIALVFAARVVYVVSPSQHGGDLCFHGVWCDAQSDMFSKRMRRRWV
jgi:hypothetical protein